jgi:hypothetical protein
MTYHSPALPVNLNVVQSRGSANVANAASILGQDGAPPASFFGFEITVGLTLDDQGKFLLLLTVKNKISTRAIDTTRATSSLLACLTTLHSSYTT